MPMAENPPLNLRPFAAADLPFFSSLARDRQVTRFVGDGQPWAEARVAERARRALAGTAVEEAGASRWFIAQKQNHASPPQDAGLLVPTRGGHEAEIGYWVAPGLWGQGIGGAMVQAAQELIPRVFGVPVLAARVRTTNVASVRALTRRGLCPTRRRRACWYTVGGRPRSWPADRPARCAGPADGSTAPPDPGCPHADQG